MLTCHPIPPNMAGQKTFSLSQIASHNSKNDCWFVIDGRVLDVTKFLEEHPGGDEVLLESAGKDASKEFKDVGHSKAAQKLLLKYQVGVLQGYSFQDQEKPDATATATAFKDPNNKEMKAFVIKTDKSRFRDVLESTVPLLVAASYLCYRYITMVDQVTN